MFDVLNLASLTHSVVLTVIIYAVNVILIAIVIFTERNSPSSTLAWIMVLAFIPIIGYILYFFFNQNMARLKIDRLFRNDEAFVSRTLMEQIKETEENRYIYSNSITVKWQHLIKLNQTCGNSLLTEGNDIELITDGKELFSMLKKEIIEAEHSINMEYYIIRDDYVGRELIELLTLKAREGVEVRLLIDAMGSRELNDRNMKAFTEAGGKLGYFFRPKIRLIIPKINYRNHRKIVIVDKKIAFTGGFNVAREYNGEKKKFGYWRDTHCRITGDAVNELNTRFVLDWRFSTGEDLEILPYEYAGKGCSGKAIQIVSSGPDDKSTPVKRAMMRMVTYAKKSIYIQTPYFVPDQSMLESLKLAVESGIDVRIMIPCKPDHIFVYWATYSYVGELLKEGARVYIYDNGFLHAKTLVADGEVCTLGSTNFDVRSFKINFETNAFVYDEDFAREMQDAFIKDIGKSHELTYKDYKKRSAIIKIKESVSRLLSDIL